MPGQIIISQMYDQHIWGLQSKCSSSAKLVPLHSSHNFAPRPHSDTEVTVDTSDSLLDGPMAYQSASKAAKQDIKFSAMALSLALLWLLVSLTEWCS